MILDPTKICIIKPAVTIGPIPSSARDPCVEAVIVLMNAKGSPPSKFAPIIGVEVITK